jgi:hypothetical protein
MIVLPTHYPVSSVPPTILVTQFSATQSAVLPNAAPVPIVELVRIAATLNVALRIVETRRAELVQSVAIPNVVPAVTQISAAPIGVSQPAAQVPTVEAQRAAVVQSVVIPNGVPAVTLNEEGDRSVVANQSVVRDRRVWAPNVVQVVTQISAVPIGVTRYSGPVRSVVIQPVALGQSVVIPHGVPAVTLNEERDLSAGAPIRFQIGAAR